MEDLRLIAEAVSGRSSYDWNGWGIGVEGDWVWEEPEPHQTVASWQQRVQAILEEV
jgi:hypothetical protein